MNQPMDDNLVTDVRVANFSGIALPLKHVLNFDPHHTSRIVDEIRRYADLPFVYLLKDGQMGPVKDVLEKLKSIRSSCYPHALFIIDDSGTGGGDDQLQDEFDLDVVRIDTADPQTIRGKVREYAVSKFVFDSGRLKIGNARTFPDSVDVVVVGAGVTGLYAANTLTEKNISCCVVDKRDVIGGIWSRYANTASQVNSSEGAYRLVERKTRSNRDHSFTREILEDIAQAAAGVTDNLYLNTEVEWVEKAGDLYRTRVRRNGETAELASKGVILAINDRVGDPRTIQWDGRSEFRGEIVSGISDEAKGVDWKNKKVVVIGMGAFAIENTRTALENGATEVTVVCRRHGTVCPKIIDYLNFATPYDENFEHDKKSNMRNMILWKKTYDQSGATQPECWMGKIKHDGHTISVSDLWFIGHYLEKIGTITGNVTGMYENGVIVENETYLNADVVVNCVGFLRNAMRVKDLCSYRETYNNNYLDKDLMYLADAHIDDDAFNSFFGSSVLEMVKFYMGVYTFFFDNPEFDAMIRSDGIEKRPIEDRKWSHYIAGAAALTRNYPDIYGIAQRQVTHRTKNFLEAHDLDTYISQNKREWIDTHALLTGRPMKEKDCMPYVFQKLIDKR